MEQLFEGKVAIVTGGGSGIGQATAILYAQHKAKVIVCDINEKDGAKTVSMIKSNDGEATFVKADVSDAQECEALVKQTVQSYGKLDIAFNNAGIGGETNMIADMSIEGWLKVINVNLNSVFYCMKYQIPEMLKQGHGAIVNMSSILGQVAFSHSSAYVMLNMLHKAYV
jgi:NAD(P)-dependent dehydrogenase (short-subunit alcohol dehydrogenase family)